MGVCGAVWACVFVAWFVCVCGTVSLVDWFAGAVWARVSVETGRWSRQNQSQTWLVYVCGWYINSEEKNFGKGFGQGMAMSLLVHKN